jgi:hypothetical protein
MSRIPESPDLPFDVLKRSLGLLAEGPGQPVLGGGRRARPLDVPSVLRLLRCDVPAVADPVWRRVVARSRSGEPVWTVVAAGALLPRLARSRARLVRGWGVSVADVEAEMLAAVLAELRAMDPAAVSDIGSHLWFAAVRAATRCRDTARRDVQHRVESGERQTEPSPPPQGAEQARGAVSVLAEAIGAGVLTRTEAEVIARTRLERQTLRRVAADLGLVYVTARRLRHAAERRLVAALKKSSPPVSAFGL